MVICVYVKREQSIKPLCLITFFTTLKKFLIMVICVYVKREQSIKPLYF